MSGCTEQDLEKDFFGQPGVPGYALARLIFHRELSNTDVQTIQPLSVPEEVIRFQTALEKSRHALQDLLQQNEHEDAREILEAHLLMLSDPEWISTIHSKMDSGQSSLQAVLETGKEFAELLSALEDPYLKARALDVADLTQRVCGFLSSNLQSVQSLSLSEECILAAKDLFPTQLLSLNMKLLKGLVLESSSRTSHTMILAKALEIPVLLAVSMDSLSSVAAQEPQKAALDASTGRLVLNPSAKTLKWIQETIYTDEQRRAQEEIWVSKASQSADGVAFEVACNLTSSSEADLAKKKSPEGCGLFRSEFLLIGKSHVPSEQEQLNEYEKVVQKMAPHRTVIRLFDIGGDKQVPELQVHEEENPFLGVRGYRLLQKYPNVLKTQLKSCLRASRSGPVSIMAPMITTLEEILHFKSQVNLAVEELKTENKIQGALSYEIGVMLEVPSLAMILPEAVQHVDFLSVGTNDLIQYLCASDRLNKEVVHLQDPYNPALLRFLKLITDQLKPQLKDRKIWLGMCGDLASYSEFTPLLMALGFRELSVPSSDILKIRKAIANTKMSYANQLLQEALRVDSSQGLSKLLKSHQETNTRS